MMKGMGMWKTVLELLTLLLLLGAVVTIINLEPRAPQLQEAPIYVYP